MSKSNENNLYPPFRPALRGCVAKDMRLARAVQECYAHALYKVAADTYRSLLCEGVDETACELFDCIAVDEAEQFRLLGELIVALGGNPVLQTGIRVEPVEISCRKDVHGNRAVLHMLRESAREEHTAIDRLETLMSRTQDRVVRSLIAYILTNEQRHAERLKAAMP